MAAAQQEDLLCLEQLLHERLQSDLPQADALKIGCAISDGTLVVLSQHPKGVEFDLEKTFATFQQALESLQPQVAQPVKLYLRVVGEQQTYAKHYFTLQPSQLAAVNNSSNQINLDNLREQAAQLTESVDLSTNVSTVPETEESDLTVELANAATINHSARNWDQPQWHNSDFKGDNLPEQDAPRLSPPRSFSLRHLRLSKSPPAVVMGGGVLLATIFSSFYILTRPCVIGPCQPLETAQQLSRVANHMSRWANSGSDLLIAQQQIAEAENLLNLIPRWSWRYQAAQQLSHQMSEQSVLLESMIAALQHATVAVQTGQKLPHSVLEWQAIQAQWQRAIALITTIPGNSNLSKFAQKKLSEYQASLSFVQQQLKIEQQASKQLLLAQNTARLAKSRQATAKSWQTWQKVKATWQTAVNILTAIPKSTTAYPEAQQLLGNYRTQLAAVGDRSSNEQVAFLAFSEAIKIANLAKQDEQQNQLSKAVSHWKQALNFAKQVPSGTQYYNQVQPLIASYSSTLQETQTKLRVANILQKVRKDISRTCSGKVKVCNYAVNTQLILVQLTSGYEQTVERSYVNAKLRGDSNTQTDVIIHYRTLKQALEAISDNAGIPLQVNESNGSLIHRYQPK